MQLEKTLGIDRKTRKQESSESIPEYLAALRQRAKEWLDTDERLLKIYCPHCNIMVGRISGVYATTEYNASFQCPQCNKRIIVKRQERDVFYDVKDAAWRRKYPIEIEQPKRTSAPASVIVDNELLIGNEE
jgi:DNA-directed RNA polymerase subunit RPC12/RpoP